VTLRVYRDRAYGVIEVTDTGSGMDALFIEQDLFRPFLSTKGSKGMGIGAYQARTLLRSLGGDIEVSSTPGQGSRFRLLFSCPESEPKPKPVPDPATAATAATAATNHETTDTHAPKEAGDG
jgi:signal transduction histidine kinase